MVFSAADIKWCLLHTLYLPCGYIQKLFCSQTVLYTKLELWLKGVVLQENTNKYLISSYKTSPTYTYNMQHQMTGHAKTCLRVSGDSESPDQPVQLCSLIRASTVHKRNHSFYSMYKWRAKAWMILCTCAGWSVYVHFMNVQRHFIAWRHKDDAIIILTFGWFSPPYNIYPKYLLSIILILVSEQVHLITR